MRNYCCLGMEFTAHSNIKTEVEYLGRDADGLGDVLGKHYRKSMFSTFIFSVQQESNLQQIINSKGVVES